MAPRLELQAFLEVILGTSAVYFQPPANVQMVYPAIVYERITANTEFAGNFPYRYSKRYQLTVIDRNPDSEIPDRVARLPTCVHNRHFVANNLHHDVFNLYY